MIALSFDSMFIKYNNYDHFYDRKYYYRMY